MHPGHVACLIGTTSQPSHACGSWLRSAVAEQTVHLITLDGLLFMFSPGSMLLRLGLPDGQARLTCGDAILQLDGPHKVFGLHIEHMQLACKF